MPKRGYHDITAYRRLFFLDELVPPGRAVSQFYIADFGPHTFRV